MGHWRSQWVQVPAKCHGQILEKCTYVVQNDLLDGFMNSVVEEIETQ